MADAKKNLDGTEGDLFHLATLLARKGSYTTALEALQQALASHHCTEVEALDLQARIYAQQGLLLAAESCWREAAAQSDSADRFASNLMWLRRAFPRVNPLIRVALFCVAAAVLSLIIWQVLVFAPRIGRQQYAAEASLLKLQNSIADLQTSTHFSERELVAKAIALDSSFRELQDLVLTGLEAAPTTLQLQSILAATSVDLGESIAATNEILVGLDSSISRRLTDIEMRINTADPTVITAEDIASLNSSLNRLQRRLTTLNSRLQPPSPVGGKGK